MPAPSLDVSVLIHAPAGRVLKAFFDPDALAAWWLVARSVTTARALGPYAVEWPPTDFRDWVGRAEKTLPQIQSLNAFPTSIFIGKDGTVKRIHQGYDGPATGQHFEDFKKEFYGLMNELLNEK